MSPQTAIFYDDRPIISQTFSVSDCTVYALCESFANTILFAVYRNVITIQLLASEHDFHLLPLGLAFLKVQQGKDLEAREPNATDREGQRKDVKMLV